MKQSKYNLHKKENSTHIIYNTLSGGVLSLNNEYSQKFEEAFKNDFVDQNDLIEELKKGQMLILNDVDEFNYLKFIYNESRFSGDIMTLTIAPTLDCNFRCPYCYEKGVNHSYMSESTQLELIEFIKANLENKKMLSICWYGGEPLLSIDIIGKMTKKIKDLLPETCKYTASMVSNGYHLTPEMVDTLKLLDINKLQITIDGPKSLHDSKRFMEDGSGSYDIITSNLKNIGSGIDIIIRVNVDKSNIDYIFDFIEEMKKLELIKKFPFYLAPVDNINNTCSNIKCLSIAEFSKKEIEVYKVLQKELNRSINLPDPITSVCGAVSPRSFVISPDGSIYKCWNDIGRHEERVGTLSNGIIFNNNMLKWMNYTPMNDKKCETCNVAPICMGGCPQKAIQNDNKCSVSKFNIIDKFDLFCSNSQI